MSAAALRMSSFRIARCCMSAGRRRALGASSNRSRFSRVREPCRRGQPPETGAGPGCSVGCSGRSGGVRRRGRHHAAQLAPSAFAKVARSVHVVFRVAQPPVALPVASRRRSRRVKLGHVRRHVHTVSVKMRRTCPSSFPSKARGNLSGKGTVATNCRIGTSVRTWSTRFVRSLGRGFHRT